MERYRQFVFEGIGPGAPWDAVKGRLLLGSDAFVAHMSHHLPCQAAAERNSAYSALRAMPEQLGNGPKAERNRCICRAHLEYGYSLAAIGQVFGLHYSTVSKIVKAAENE